MGYDSTRLPNALGSNEQQVTTLMMAMDGEKAEGSEDQRVDGGSTTISDCTASLPSGLASTTETSEGAGVCKDTVKSVQEDINIATQRAAKNEQEQLDRLPPSRSQPSLQLNRNHSSSSLSKTTPQSAIDDLQYYNRQPQESGKSPRKEDLVRRKAEKEARFSSLLSNMQMAERSPIGTSETDPPKSKEYRPLQRQTSSTTTPSSQALEDERAHLLPVEVVDNTEELKVVAIRGHVQDYLLKTLSSLVAHEVKDMRKEGSDYILVLSIPDHANKSTSILDLEQQLLSVLKETAQWEDCRRDLDAKRASDPTVLLPDDPAKANVSRKGLPQLASGGKLTNTSKALSLAPRFNQDESIKALRLAPVLDQDEDCLQPPNSMEEMFAEIYPDDPGIYGAASEEYIESGYSFSEHVGDAERSRQRRPSQDDTTPGAFRIPSIPFAPEWDERNQETLLSEREEVSAHVVPMIDSTESSATIRAFRVDEIAQEENARLRILEEAVEADVVDHMEATKARRKRLLLLICLIASISTIAIGLGVAQSRKESSIVLVTEAPSMAPSGRPTELARPTLEKVLSRGTLRCGAADNIPAVSAFKEETNSTEGFNVDLCRAIAAAVIGDSSRLEIVPLSGVDRFETLLHGSIDVLARSETHTLAREVVESTTGAGFSFSAPFLYSGLVFAGVEPFVDCAETLDTFFGICKQLKVCAGLHSSLEGVMDTLFPSSFIHRTVSEMEAFVNGACNVVATEPLYSHETVFRAAGYSGALKWGTVPFSREPLAFVTRSDDPEWSDLVNAVLQALMVAEVQNVTQITGASFRSTPELGNFREGMFSDAITAVGNYGEIFARHLDGVIPRTGLNSLNLNGSTGLLYSLPFGVSEEDVGPEPIQGGTLRAILDRGYLRCGLISNITGFAKFNTTSQEWTGLDVSFCRVVFAAVFAEEFDATIEFVSLPDTEQYIALASGDIDILAGGMASLVSEVLEPTSSTGFSFSSPYFYGSPHGNLSDASTRSLVTRQDDSQWSTFVYWALMSTIFAEEQVIGRTMTHLMPVVNLFGDRFAQMFRVIVASNGNYGDIYEDALEEHIPRAGRNQLNSNDHHGPQQYPYKFP